MASVRKMFICKNTLCKNEKGKHRGYKKVFLGEPSVPCKHCGIDMILGDNHVARITKGLKTFTRSMPNKKQATEYLAECVSARRRGELMPGEEREITWEKANEIFEDDMEDRLVKGKSSETVDYYRSCMRTLKGKWGKHSLQEIEEHEVVKWLAERRKTVGTSIVNGNLAILKILYKLVCKRLKARQYPRLHEAYLDIYKIERYDKKQEREIVILETDEEINTFLSYCKNPTLHHFVFGILNTGLRHKDMLKLRENEINWERGEITTVVKGNKTVVIPMTQQYKDYVKEWVKCQRLKTMQRHLFPSPIHPGACLNVRSQFGWAGACERTYDHFMALKKPAIAKKFKSLLPHHLRHTMATHYLYKTSAEYGSTIAIFKLSLILGHSTEYITKTYMHRLGHQDQAAMESFGEQMWSEKVCVR